MSHPRASLSEAFWTSVGRLPLTKRDTCKGKKSILGLHVRYNRAKKSVFNHNNVLAPIEEGCVKHYPLDDDSASLQVLWVELVILVRVLVGKVGKDGLALVQREASLLLGLPVKGNTVLRVQSQVFRLPAEEAAFGLMQVAFKSFS